MEESGRWYVVHTYSGYENKVMANIMKIVENRNMQDVIFEVKVPIEEQVEIKNGKKKVTQKKVFPGYVLVKMLMTDESWYVVRNTRGVTGFVGPGSKPVPLTDVEVKALGVEKTPIKLDANVKDHVRVTSGPFENFVGIIQEINNEKHKVKVMISMFGRETPVELEFTQVERL
jgi:transcriptional antiterminator NusG